MTFLTINDMPMKAMASGSFSMISWLVVSVRGIHRHVAMAVTSAWNGDGVRLSTWVMPFDLMNSGLLASLSLLMVRKGRISDAGASRGALLIMRARPGTGVGRGAKDCTTGPEPLLAMHSSGLAVKKDGNPPAKGG